MRNKPIEAEADILNQYHEDILRLQNREYAGLSFRRFDGLENTFYFNTSYSDRLIVTEEPTRVLIAKEIKNHVYRRKAIEAAIKKCKNSPNLKRFEAKDEAVTDFPLSNESPVVAHKPGRMTFYKKHMLFSEQQFETLQKQLPMKVSGGPGSGKTCVARELLVSKAIQATRKHPLCLLYVTKSPNLAKEMSNQLKTHPLYRKIKRLTRKGHLQIHFKTTDEALGRPKQKPEEQEQNLNLWLKAYINRMNPLSKLLYAKAFDEQYPLFKEPKLLLEEFRGMAGKGRAKYAALGGQFSYVIKNERHVFYDAFEDYCRMFPKDGLNPVNEAEIEAEYDRIVYDEAQDDTEEDLKAMMQKAHDKQIAFFNSNIQRLVDGLSNEANFTSLSSDYYALEEVYLTQSFRNPGVISALINHVEDVQHGFMKCLFEKPSREPKLEPFYEKPGFVDWITPEELKKPFVRSIKRAIITLPQYRDEAIALFGSSLVFTIDEIKGLEFEEVYFYKFFDDEAYKEINKVLEGKPIKPILRPQNFTTAFNKIKTAFSRSTQYLFVVQDRHHDIQTLAKQIEAGFPKNTKPLETKEEKEADSKELLAKAKDLYKTNAQQALGLLTRELQKSQAEAESLIAQWKSEEKPVPQNPLAQSKPQKTKPQATETQEAKVEAGFDYEKYCKHMLGALVSLNKKNLKKLNQLFDLSQFIKFLSKEMTKLAQGEESLSQKLLNDSEKMENLQIFLKNSIYIQNMAEYLRLLSDYDSHALLRWASHSIGSEIFKDIVLQTNFAEQLQTSKLYEMPAPVGSKHSLATYLACDSERCQILEKFFIKKPEFMVHLSASLSLKNIPQAVYVFQALSLSSRGRKLIKTMSNDCPQVLAALDEIKTFAVPEFLNKEEVQKGLRQLSKKPSQQAPSAALQVSKLSQQLCQLTAEKKLKETVHSEKIESLPYLLKGLDLVKEFSLSKEALSALFKHDNVIHLLFNVPKGPYRSLFAYLLDPRRYDCFHEFITHPENISAAITLGKCLSSFAAGGRDGLPPLTVFYLLSRIPKGINLLAYFFSLDSSILVSKETLCSKDKAGLSTLYHLITTKSDISGLIVAIIQREPNLVLDLLPEDLSFPALQIANPEGKLLAQICPSLLNLLCRYKKFQVLEFIMSRNPELLLKDFKRDLNELCEVKELKMVQTDFFIENCGLYRLIESEGACKIFYEILKHLSRATPVAYAARIFIMLTNTYKGNQSFWSLLMHSSSGENIASLLKLWNPSLKINAPEAKPQPHEEKNLEQEIRQPTFMQDLQDSVKREQWLSILSSPVKIKSLRHLLTSQFFSEASSDGASKLLAFLHQHAASAVCTLGVHFFLLYIIYVKDFAFSRDALFLKRRDNYAAFFVLSAHPLGNACLDCLQKKNPGMFQSMQPEDLYLKPWIKEKPYFEDEDYHPFENTTPMYWLAGTSGGARLLWKFCQLNPGLLSALTPDVFYSNSHNGAGKKNSIFQQLVQTQEGCETLNYILQNCKGLAEAIPKAALFDPVPSDPSAHALYYLEKFKAQAIYGLFPKHIQALIQAPKVTDFNTPFNFLSPKKTQRDPEEKCAVLRPQAS